MKILTSKKRVCHEQLRYIERDKLVAIEYSSFVDDKQIPLSAQTWFAARANLPDKITLKSLKSERMHGIYYTKKCIKSLSHCKNGNEFFNLIPRKGNALIQIKHPNFDAKNVIWFDSGNHTFVRLLEQDTLASITPYHFDYIGGISEVEWDFDGVKTYLENHQWVTNLKVGHIPYYQDNAGAKFLYISILLPQEEMNKLVVYCRDTKPTEYWQTRIKDAIVAPYNKDIDPLGIKKFYRGERRYGD